MFADTHTHLYDDAFDNEGDAAVSRAVDAGVTKLVFPDINCRTREAMFALAGRHPGVVFPCLGLHPTDVEEDWRAEMDAIVGYRPPMDIVAIGEIGMDCHWSTETVQWQEEAFRAQLDLSLERGLPVIIHNRDATALILNVLQDYRGRGLRGVFHAFSGSYETFCSIEKCGDFYIGVGGVVTFPKASIAETVRKIPTDRIVTETDSPYLTPVPFRGRRNESAYIPYIVEKIAERKNVDPDAIASATWENAHRLFNI